MSGGLFLQFCALVAILVSVYADTCASVTNANKNDCGFVGSTQSSCEASGCCWAEVQDDTTPWCFYAPTEYNLNDFAQTKFGSEGTLKFSSSNSNDATITDLKLQFIYESVDTFRVKITDANNSGDINNGGSWEIPQDVIQRQDINSIKAPSLDSLSYKVEYQETPFRFQVIRKSDDVMLFDLAEGITYQNQYIRLSTRIDGESKTYGLGESTRTNQALNSGTYTLWAADMAAAGFDRNLYGAFPYYLQLLPSGVSHGAMLMNSNGMDIVLNNDGNSADENTIAFNTIGGIIDLYIFSGSDPKSVVKQYTSIVGLPMMMPYWSLGFHNCKYGYTNVAEVEDVVKNYQNANLPLDIQWMDIDYMQSWRDWTWDGANFPEEQVSKFVDNLHDEGLHFVPIVDPGIMVYSGYDAYEKGMKEGIFVKDVTQESYFLGQVWPGPVYFPDFLNPLTQSYWTNSISKFHDSVKVDGLWIDMNEVSNFCNEDGAGQVCTNPDPENCPTGDLSTQTTCCLSCTTVDSTNKYDFPTQYNIHNQQGNGALGSKTMSPSTWHYGNVSSYNVHNLYGLTEQMATNEALTKVRGERPFLLTRSSFVSSGKHTAKWTGDNAATWTDLQSSVVSIMDFNLFGIPMIGADICGFLQATTEELCARWAEVGAFYPFSRNHNSLGEPPQEFYLWESVTQAAQNAFGIRYEILPYMYTLFYQAHSTGETVARSLWLNFPQDTNTFEINDQFMLGSGIMVSPVLTEGATSVDAYFPSGIWYDYQTHAIAVDATEGPQTVTLDTPLTSVNVHIYGGTVLPRQSSAMTTTIAKQTPFNLIVALCPLGGAYGELFVDDGVQVDGDIPSNMLHMSYKASHGTQLVGSINSATYRGPEAKLPLNTIHVLGVTNEPTKVTMNSSTQSVTFTYDSSTAALTVSIEGLVVSEEFTLVWE
jgi:alpha-D-xyloside xylohydrolase